MQNLANPSEKMEWNSKFKIFPHHKFYLVQQVQSILVIENCTNIARITFTDEKSQPSQVHWEDMSLLVIPQMHFCFAYFLSLIVLVHYTFAKLCQSIYQHYLYYLYMFLHLPCKALVELFFFLHHLITAVCTSCLFCLVDPPLKVVFKD